MKISHLRPWQNLLPHVLVGGFLFGIYIATLAPGLTWANSGSDGGDLITAAVTNGVAHPTGYPLYLLLARLFQLLPSGSLAFRTNLMSALLTALAAGLLSHLVTRYLSSYMSTPTWPAGLVTGLAFGLSPLVWSQAVITEVYALQALLVVLILHLYTMSAKSSGAEQSRLNSGRGLVLSLGMGNHITTVFLVPVVLLLGAMPVRSERYGDSASEPSRRLALKWDGRALIQQLAGFGLGLALYLIIPLRALANPPVNWGNAVTLQRFWWLVSGQLYQGHYLHSGLAGLWERIQAESALLLQQFGLPGLLLGLLGLVVFGSRSRLYVLTTWMAVISLAFAALYGSDDSYVYLIPVFISFTIWIGLGFAGLTRGRAGRFPVLATGLSLLLIMYLAGRALVHLDAVDASDDLRAESFGREVLSTAPENAMLFAEGDRAIFALWYFHFALGQRPDLVVVASDLLHFDWYQETLRSTYPSLVVPGPFPWPETMTSANPARPACSVRYEDQTELQCAAPLTTP